MREVTTEKKPIKMWLSEIEDGAMEQVKNLANLPFTFMHVSIMPDCHQGFGMPIGGVLATDGVVIPNAVGVDIGCGMRTVKTSLMEIDKEKLVEVLKHIRKTVPVGFKHHEVRYGDKMPTIKSDMPIVDEQFTSACRQIGTLGGGNHFIEIQKGDDGHIHIMLHSGSRNIGFKVANHYNKVAKEINKNYHSQVPPSWDLAFLPLDSEEGKAYMKEMQYCLDFAKANRKFMMDNIKEGFREQFGVVKFDEDLDVHHNYASPEKHFGREVIVHRKGATAAYQDQLGIIPGSQGTSSYIVRGKGNIFSFKSCSHGAGRLMGRKVAKRTLNLKEEVDRMNAKGIMHSVRGAGELDEAPGAYKDIDVVMSNQKDLVDVVTKLEPLAVIKG